MDFTVTHKLFLTQGTRVTHILTSPITRTLKIPTFVLQKMDVVVFVRAKHSG